MKPRAKLQKRIMGLTKKIPKLTEPQKKYAYKNAHEHIGYRTKVNGICCLECGQSYKDNGYMTIEESTCPHCNTRIKIRDCRKKRFFQESYFSIITTCEEFQVIRHFHIRSWHERGEKVICGASEITQLWLHPTGKFEVVSQIYTSGYFYHENWSCDLEIRKFRNRIHNFIPDCTYNRIRVIPLIKRNGFKNEFYNISPLSLFMFILRFSEPETYLKTNQIPLLVHYIKTETTLNKYWHAIKICIRNNYIIQEVDIWKDYIDLLMELNIDTHNAKYVCPEDLHEAHNKYLYKKIDLDKKKASLSDIEIRMKEEKVYFREKSKFFGLNLSNGKIEIKVLQNLDEIKHEGIIHSHCVYNNNYYRRKDSLLLSASSNGKKLETIELSLKSYEIIQARGYDNKPTIYHNEIIELLNKNINTIRKLNTAKRHSKAA